VVPLVSALTLRRRSLLPVLVGQQSKSSLRHEPDYRLGPQHPGADLELGFIVSGATLTKIMTANSPERLMSYGRIQNSYRNDKDGQ